MKHSLLPLILFVPALFFLPCAAAAGDEEPVRALFILGGEHHPYEACSKIVADHLAKEMNIAFDFVRIDAPPEGRPAAEKATIPSNPAILEDKELGRKYDIILAYNQEAYTNLTHKQRDGLLHFVRSGGPWVGIHSAVDFLKNDRDFVRMAGGRFQTHPPFGEMRVRTIMGDHFITEGIGDFVTRDEFYYLDGCDLGDKNVLLVAESPTDKRMRPVAWSKRYGRGKVFYTVLGHSVAACENPDFLKLMHRAVLWALIREPGEPGPDGWIDLFDGRTFEGWTFCGPGRFEIEDGAFKTVGGMGLLWFDRRKFRDFTLSIEWKVGRAEDNSGIFVRFPSPPADPWTAVYEGYEIQICDTAGPKHNTGSVYGFEAPSKIASKPPGEWNLFEITVVGQTYSVVLNGETVVEVYEGDRGREGYIGLQNHDPEVVVYFRNIKVKEL